jgi:hypothetical protein
MGGGNDAHKLGGGRRGLGAVAHFEGLAGEACSLAARRSGTTVGMRCAQGPLESVVAKGQTEAGKQANARVGDARAATAAVR